jgi:hypothetical protein
MWAGLILSGTLGIKTVAMPVGIGSDNLYAVSWDHALVSIGPFTATMMLCVGFMQIFADQDQFGMIAMQLQWAREQDWHRRASPGVRCATTSSFLMAQPCC